MEVKYRSRLVKHNNQPPYVEFNEKLNEMKQNISNNQKGEKGEKGDSQLQQPSLEQLKITKLDTVQSIKLISEDDPNKSVTLKVDSKSNTLNVNDIPLGFIKVLGAFDTEEQLRQNTQNCSKSDAFTLPSSQNSLYRDLWIAKKDNPSSHEDWVNLGKFTGPRGLRGLTGEKGEKGDKASEDSTIIEKINVLESNLVTQQHLLFDAISKIEELNKTQTLLENKLNEISHHSINRN